MANFHAMAGSATSSLLEAGSGTLEAVGLRNRRLPEAVDGLGGRSAPFRSRTAPEKSRELEVFWWAASVSVCFQVAASGLVGSSVGSAGFQKGANWLVIANWW